MQWSIMKKSGVLFISLLLTVIGYAGAANHIYATEPQTQEDIIWADPELQPQFPGGVEALAQWIADNLQYPTEAIKNGIEGRVIVRFLITKSGDLEKIHVMRSPDDLLSEEAIRVVKLLPKFTPGMVDGEPVNVWFTLPLTFKLPHPQNL